METREDIPLKTGSKSSSLHRCNEYFFEGSRFVTTAFVFLTSIITIALILQIYYGDFQVSGFFFSVDKVHAYITRFG